MRQKAEHPLPEVTRWACLLLRLLSRLELDDALVWAAWSLAWIEHSSRGEPTAEGPHPACAGLVGLRVDRYEGRACGDPGRQLEAFVERLGQMRSYPHRARNPASALLGVACSPFSAAAWVKEGGKAHVSDAAQRVAELHPRAAAYLAWLRAWGLAGRPRRRVVLELPARVIRWRSGRRSGQVLAPEWRGVHEVAVHTTPPAQVAALPAVLFKLGGYERTPPGPTLEDEVRGVLLEVAELPPAAVRRLARALGLKVHENAPLTTIRAALRGEQASVMV